MKSDIKRLSYNNTYIIWFALVLILLFAFAFLYKSNAVAQDNYFDHQIYYNTIDEIPSKISDLEVQLNNLMLTDLYYQEQINRLEDSKSIYEFLYENEIDYEDVAEINGIYETSYDQVTLLSGLVQYLLFAFIILLLFTVIYLINQDFNTGVYKFVYGRNKSRASTVFSKLKIYYVVLLGFLFVFTVILILFLYPVGNDFKYVLFVNKGTVYLISVFKYLVLIYLSVVSVIIFYSIIIFSMSLFINNTLNFILIFGSIFLILQVLIPMIDIDFLTSMVYVPVFLLNQSIAPNIIIISIIVKYIVSIILLILSIWYFNRKNLYSK